MALSKLVGRVEWVAGNSAMIGDEHWSTEPIPARAVTEQVAETLHQSAALICDGEGHPVNDPARIEAVQQATRELDQLMTAALEADVTSLTESETALPPEAGPGGDPVGGPRASPVRSTPVSMPARSDSPPKWWPMPLSKQRAPRQR